MKRLVFTLVLLIITSVLSGQELNKKPKIGLVLSGGGAKGFAHIGVLKVLEEAKIPIDYIAGTSIGGIVGGLYACGYDAVTLERIFKKQNLTGILSNEFKSEFSTAIDKEDEARYIVSFPFDQKKIALSNGVFNGQNVMELLSYLTLGYHDVYDFSKLPIPFICIATNLATGDEVVLDRGYLPKAIRASMAVPAAFTSVEIDGQMLVDGGIVNNYPVDRCKAMGADYIIGVDIMDSMLTVEELKDIPNVVAQMMNFMDKKRVYQNAREVDLHIRPNIKGYSVSSFSNESAQILIKRGEDAARKVLPQLIHLRDSLHLEVKKKPFHKEMRNDTTLVINNIEVTGTDRAKITFYLGQVGIKHDQRVTLEHLRNGISRLYSTGNYEFVNYQLVGIKSLTLKIEVKERKNNKVNAGLHYDSDFNSSMLVNVTLRNQNFFGSRLSLDTKLSQYPMFSANYSIDRGWKPGLYSKLMYVEDHIYRYGNEKKIAEIDLSLINLQLATHSFITDATRFAVGASMDGFKLGTVIGDTSGYRLRPKTYFNLFSRIEHNSLNKIYFPTRGVNVGGGVKLLLNDWTTNPIIIGDFYLKRARAVSDRITYIYSLNSRLVFGRDESYFHHTFLGGVQQTDYFSNTIPFNGIRRMELNTSSVGVGRLEFRLKIWEKIYVSLSGEIGMYSNENLSFANQNTIFGYGLNAAYNSAVGPLEFNLSFSSLDRDILPYLSLGFWF